VLRELLGSIDGAAVRRAALLPLLVISAGLGRAEGLRDGQLNFRLQRILSFQITPMWPLACNRVSVELRWKAMVRRRLSRLSKRDGALRADFPSRSCLGHGWLGWPSLCRQQRDTLSDLQNQLPSNATRDHFDEPVTVSV
jgi:hypothetical protein